MNTLDLEKNIVANGRAIVLSLFALHLAMFVFGGNGINAAGAVMAIVALAQAYCADCALLHACRIEQQRREPAIISRRVARVLAALCIASTILSGLWAVIGLDR